MKKIIKSLEKGWGDTSIFYSTDEKIKPPYKLDEIKEEAKDVGCGLHTVYRGYIGAYMVFEMGASIDVTVTFYP